MSVRHTLLALTAAGLLAAATAHAAAVTVTVRCEPSQLQADENGSWVFTTVLRNDGATGAYGDSVLLDILPEGAPARTQKLFLAGATQALSAGDSVETQVNIVATAARARLVVRYFAHASDGTSAVASATVTAAGSVLEDRYPAGTLRAGGQGFEFVKVRPDEGAANGAGVLVLTGEALATRELLVPASRLAALGCAVVIVRVPAAEVADAPARAAAWAALDTLVALGAKRDACGAWGVSRGGTLALQLAAEKPAAFRAVAAQSARYEGLSPKTAPAIRAALLVLHGEQDAVNAAAGAHAFAQAAVQAAGGATGKFLPAGRHDLPATEAVRFLKAKLAPAP